MTKPVSTPAGQLPAAASDLGALPPGPGKAQPNKRNPGSREFADVIDQASARKPAHVRGTKSASRRRQEESTAPRPHDVGTAQRPARPRSAADASTAPTSRKERRAARAVETQADGPNETDHTTRTTPAGTKAPGVSNPSSTTGESDGSADTETHAAEVSGTNPAPADESNTDAAPTNIIPFPGPGANVIVPFPLAEAQAIPAIAASSAGASSATAIATTPASAPAIIPTTTPAAIAPDAAPSENAREGIDVTQLGLKPVMGGETLNVPVPTQGPETAKAQPNNASATDLAPASSIVSVMFNSTAAIDAVSEPGDDALSPESVLPGDAREAEEAARRTFDTPASASSAKIVLLRTDAAKPAPDGAQIDVPHAPAPAAQPAGISSARQEDRMESTIASEELAARAAQTESAGESSPARVEFIPRSTAAGPREASEFADRTKVATDWQTGRLVIATDRPVSEITAPAPSERTDATTTVERISSLVLREAGLVKKHGSDSMAVVLRPDAETELFVHLTQRNGQVEASVRCERGDAQHLGTLWPQLQEALAQQKVRLAPLEESAAARNEFQSQPGSWTSNGGDRGARQDSRPSTQQSMDEWPAPPATTTATPHVRGGEGTRGRRISTSRPGWETWA